MWEINLSCGKGFRDRTWGCSSKQWMTCVLHGCCMKGNFFFFFSLKSTDIILDSSSRLFICSVLVKMLLATDDRSNNRCVAMLNWKFSKPCYLIFKSFRVIRWLNIALVNSCREEAIKYHTFYPCCRDNWGQEPLLKGSSSMKLWSPVTFHSCQKPFLNPGLSQSTCQNSNSQFASSFHLCNDMITKPQCTLGAHQPKE